MFQIVLFQPEIPPNTGNVIRLAANSGCVLHLVEPLGFDVSAPQLRRAGLDYAEFVDMQVHADWAACLLALGEARRFAFSTRGTARYDRVSYQPGDAFIFGPESRGLPAEMLAALPPENRLRLPMMPDNRSLNLSNTVAIAVYEAWRQQGFAGGL
ncbi:MAG: tRNA (cytidine(34)-2'-O)-methyltransferase [Rhodocyclaceae bacterium]|nr:tRNA (cytidine(34)-2'-O)-methyltransferase [Rhodocyclaceae bacterium]